MNISSEHNFAGLLVRNLGESSRLVDAATGLTLSGRDLSDRIVGFASGFLFAGLRAGDRLLVSCAQSFASTLAYLGAMYAGIVPVPVEESLLSTYGDQLIAKSRARAVWTNKVETGNSVNKTNVLHLVGSFEPQTHGSLEPSRCAESDLAALMSTSGSTGTPRLVMVSHGNLRSNTEAIIRSQRLPRGETAMLVMPISYCFGASVMHTHLFVGGSVVFDSRFMFPDKVLHALNTYNCATFAGVPFVYDVLLRRSNLKSIPIPGLHRFLQAGGALAPESVREWCRIVPTAEFFLMYGQTEATARISCASVARLSDKLGSAGLLLDNLEVRIAHEGGRALPKGQIGEIQVRGPSVCCGYFEDPEGTDQKFRGGWLKTGDLACCDDDGYLWIKGRTEEFVKIRGRRVSIAEVESRIGTISGVTDCAAIGVKHPDQGESLALLVVAEDSEDLLTERIRQVFPPHWTGAVLKYVNELPRTANGKISRSRLATLL
jgi:acyl-CoA synthetase (AMP-forming)/AMP-acid ligase II